MRRRRMITAPMDELAQTVGEDLYAAAIEDRLHQPEKIY
jgi:hypothetical protein